MNFKMATGLLPLLVLMYFWVTMVSFDDLYPLSSNNQDLLKETLESMQSRSIIIISNVTVKDINIDDAKINSKIKLKMVSNHNKDQKQEAIVEMDKYEKMIFDDGKDIEGYLKFYNLSNIIDESLSNGKEYYKKRDLSKCKNVTLLFPHVPKAGGRSIAFTFSDRADLWGPSMSYVYGILNDTSPRTRYNISFETTRGHLYLTSLAAKKLNRAMHYGLSVASDTKYDENTLAYYNNTCKKKLTNSENMMVCAKLAGGSCRAYIYLLREPISRLISAFYASQGGGRHWRCTENVNKKVKSQASAKEQNNDDLDINDRNNDDNDDDRASDELNKIHKEPNIADWLALPKKERLRGCVISNFHAKYISSDFKGKSAKESLMFARMRLLQMDWFGLTSRFEESMAMISHMLNIDLLKYRTIFNYNTYKVNITQDMKEKISEGQEVDILLYRLAEKVFDIRWKSLVQKLGQRKPSQTFECDKKVLCFSGASPIRWFLGEQPPKEYWNLRIEDQRRCLCASKTGCKRTQTW